MTRPRRAGLVAALSALVGATSLAGVPTASAAAPEPVLRLVAASKTVTAERYVDEETGEANVYLELGTHLVAGAKPFEVRVTRKSYRDPIVASQVLRSGRSTTVRRLPAGLVTDFRGFRNFLNVTLKDKSGRTVFNSTEGFCPNGYESARTRPDAPATSPYPDRCSFNPFALGDVWGVQAGWATPTGGQGGDLAEGTYTAYVSITPIYQKLFGIPAAKARATVAVTVRTVKGGGDDARSAAGARAAVAGRSAAALRPAPRPAAGTAKVPTGSRPDLRPLPAWGIGVSDGSEDSGKPTGKDYLSFNANVWNAGPSPLVVDGFRRPGKDLMDAYQYFYDSKGRQVGYAPTGTLEYDKRDGHAHWHFTDFARYQLLRADKKAVVRSQKEAFCLVPTDSIDLTVRGAAWKPAMIGLHSACGGSSSLAIREILDVGWGDTYTQSLPGQSFDITTLPNGTYYIQVTANPDKRLYERSLRNNVTLRKVILGGTKGHRTVKVPRYGRIDAP